MKTTVYNFSVSLGWELIRIISQIDRFDASWSTIEKREGASLAQLRTMATIKSVGASTRIEGSKMSDAEVQDFLKELDVSKLEDRDKQEVAGYFASLDIIIDGWNELRISESSIKSLHNVLMKYNPKDVWHRGNYKQHSNAVEANFPDGSRQIIFETTPPGYPTEDQMRSLISWYNQDTEVHALVKSAVLAYEFLSIHPFQDGNGRLSRLLTTLSLLSHGYSWIQYVSFEHEIEESKNAYYRSLRHCQAQRPGEDITEWISYFLTSLINVQDKLSRKLERSDVKGSMSPKEKQVYTYIAINPGCKSGQVSKDLSIPKPTAKRIIADMVSRDILEKFGRGAGVNYSIK
ncbi:Fic family protein [Lewinella sp. JB7]|uniref:Fic family protein n=1 Tax=Lewinella sp. JB7 TaxID=2962887 RepID=UPI0020C98817|nr:Fic family protein [Lewinella sp. JB7]MCP9237728.1 Fic family protein [Lewinella sp. JB7]